MGGADKITLVKLMSKVKKIEAGTQHGLGKFEFGTGKLAYLKNKISLDEELDLIMADKMDDVPNSSVEIGVKTKGLTLETLFIQDTNFLLYYGQQTFDECGDTTWIISLDPAAISEA